uniref:RING-type domain-containing protein n=1 Tax=Accipiter nisus TaxID=211598 RepID=A0A8B9N8A5_9AVES
MPIRAHCTICSDFFDNERDVAAVPCGHTFHRACLIQWFDTAPSRTCPQCRIQVKPSRGCPSLLLRHDALQTALRRAWLESRSQN